jgi:predicted lipid-binding transport protein (Tim44 family)
VFAALALVVVAVLVYFIWPSSSVGPAGSTASSVTTSGAAQAGVGSSAVAATATATGTPTAAADGHATPVAAWSAGKGGATLAAIRSHLGTALMANSVGQLSQMRQECKALAIDLKLASGQAPIPDVTVQSLYVKARASLTAGAAKCKAGIKGTSRATLHANKTLLSKAVSELNTGGRELSSATGKIKK